MSRSAAIARGVAALLLLAGLLVGVPLWLTTVAGSPIPDVLPSLDQIWTALTSRDDGTMLLGVLKYAAWTGWALFAASVLVDLLSRLRGIPVPRLGPQQHLASSLVTAVAALAVILPTGASTASASATTASVSTRAAAPVAATAVDARLPWVQALAVPALAAEPTADKNQQFTRYTVRKGDCLWDIAWNELGDPERWPELYEASRHLEQPDGRHITDPDLIYPGWVIRVPAAAREREPNTQARGETPHEQTVVTPLSGILGDAPGSSVSPQTPGFSPTSHPAAVDRVVTPLNSQADIATPIAASTRWSRTLAAHDNRVSPRDWRGSLAPEGQR